MYNKQNKNDIKQIENVKGYQYPHSLCVSFLCKKLTHVTASELEVQGAKYTQRLVLYTVEHLPQTILSICLLLSFI